MPIFSWPSRPLLRLPGALAHPTDPDLSTRFPFAEIQCWSHATNALTSFREKYASPSTSETLARVNRLISAWPATDGGDQPLDGYEQFRQISKKLTASLTTVKADAEAETK